MIFSDAADEQTQYNKLVGIQGVVSPNPFTDTKEGQAGQGPWSVTPSQWQPSPESEPWSRIMSSPPRGTAAPPAPTPSRHGAEIEMSVKAGSYLGPAGKDLLFTVCLADCELPFCWLLAGGRSQLQRPQAVLAPWASQHCRCLPKAGQAERRPRELAVKREGRVAT